jgi:glycosyltransferase involved in cell wall biosynthesis
MLVAPIACGDRDKQPRDDASFAVAIAAYNAAPFLGEAIESALSQTRQPSQVIVCDDGSSDDTAAVATSYAPRVTLLRQQHRGVGAAKNACVQAATAEYVVVLDADNILLRPCLEAFSAVAFARPDLDIITSDAYLEIDGTVFDRYYRRKARFIVDDQRLGALHQHFIYGQAALRRTSIDAAGGYDEQLACGVDTDLFLRMILNGSRAGLILEPLSHYRLRPGSLSSDRARSMESMITMLEGAARHPSLSEDERRILLADLVAKRRLALLALAERDLRNGSPEARTRTVRIARNDPAVFALTTRVKAAVATAAPSIARRLLELREARSGRSELARATHGR